VGTRYELSAGEMSLDTRVLLRIQAHPGCSVRKVREGVNGKAEDIGAAIKRLIARGAVEDRGDAAGMKLYAAEGGNHSGNHPGSDEKWRRTATEPPSGTGVVPDPKPLGEDREPPREPPPTDLFEDDADASSEADPEIFEEVF
jgi:hypothetical protein